MGRKEVLAERKKLEEFYYNCKMETPEEVAKQFEVYTKLIWDFHQAGLCYDYYCDTTTTRLEGTGKWIGGHDALEVETLLEFSPFPSNKTNFQEIYCVGDPENGYHFGQVTSPSGVYSKEGATLQGRGDGAAFKEGDAYTLCECYVKKVNGRWCIVDEFVIGGQEVTRRRLSGSKPFCKTILDLYDKTAEGKEISEASDKKEGKEV